MARAGKHPPERKRLAQIMRRWITAGALLTVLILAGIWIVSEQTRPLRITATDLSESSARLLLEYITCEGWLKRKAVLASQNEAEPGNTHSSDIQIATWSKSLASNYVSTLSVNSAESMPRSIQAVGLGPNNARIALPIALDHVEFSFRRDLFAKNGLVVDDRIISFSDLNSVLHTFVAKDFFPLLVAGGDDRSLLDFLAVLVVSMSGVEAYDRVESNLAVLDWSNVDELKLVMALPELTEALEWMRMWKLDGVLHPDWLDFSPDDVLSIARLRLTASCVMRLSEHRQWPVGVLQNWQTSPFPFRDPQSAGSALLAPVVVAMIPQTGRYSENLVPLVTLLSGKEFQETVVQDWGLAPVHNTAEALDRESSDLRFWAAASRRLVPGWDAELSKESLSRLADIIRTALR